MLISLDTGRGRHTAEEMKTYRAAAAEIAKLVVDRAAAIEELDQGPHDRCSEVAGRVVTDYADMAFVPHQRPLRQRLDDWAAARVQAGTTADERVDAQLYRGLLHLRYEDQPNKRIYEFRHGRGQDEFTVREKVNVTLLNPREVDLVRQVRVDAHGRQHYQVRVSGSSWASDIQACPLSECEKLALVSEEANSLAREGKICIGLGLLSAAGAIALATATCGMSLLAGVFVVALFGVGAKETMESAGRHRDAANALRASLTAQQRQDIETQGATRDAAAEYLRQLTAPPATAPGTVERKDNTVVMNGVSVQVRG